MSQSFILSRVLLEVDLPRRRAIFTLPPDEPSARIARALAISLTETPALASCDWIVDTTPDPEGATSADLNHVVAADLGCRRTGERKYTYILTADRYFHLWAAALDLKFGDRLHKAFATRPPALQVLETADRS